MKRIITSAMTEDYRAYLWREEKARGTIEKYMKEIRCFAEWADQREVTKELVIQWKTMLAEALPLSRNQIWTEMKRLCAAAGVEPSKAFPHNRRYLFARTFYKAIGIEHMRWLEKLRLVS